MSRKVNCWEFTSCGREPGGDNIDELGVCLTSIYKQFDGINGGKNGGRVCWSISGTLCNGNVQGSIAEKLPYCQECGFFKKLIEEEVVDSDLFVCNDTSWAG